jgi:molybdate/tungstate transport system permease protein
VNRKLFNLAFTIAGGLLVLFVFLPLATILGTLAPRQFWLAFTDREVIHAIGRTFLAAAIATVLALISGVPLAYLLARRRFWGRNGLAALIDLPVIVPHTAAGVALLMVFGRRGLVGRWLAPLGVLFVDNMGGIVVGMLFVSLPFLVNMSREAFALIDDELERVALIDGATAWQAFWLISLPLAWRGVLGGAVMMWARGMSEFGAVIILAYHPKIAPVLIYERFQGFGLDAAQPVAAILILAALAAFSLLRWALRFEHSPKS